MPYIKHLTRSVTLGLLVLGLVLPAGASELAVASDGEIIQLVSGRYGDLFPSGNEADRSANVLALEILGGDSARLSLVPSTSDMAAELSPTLYHDPTVDITHVLWSSRHNGVHPFLRLAQYADGAWGETFDITGSVFAVKNDPQLSVHHEGWTNSAEEYIERTVFHVLWWEQLGDSIEPRLSALVLENGSLVGDTGIQTLRQFVSDGSALDSDGTDRASKIRVLSTNAGILAGFFTPDGTVHVVSSEVLPASLSRLGLAVEKTIEDFDPSGDAALGDQLIDVMLGFDSEFHPAMLAAMIESVLDLVEEELATADGVLEDILDSLSDKGMPFIVEIGSRLKNAGLAGEVVSILTVRSDLEFAHAHPHHLAVGFLASFELPADVPPSGVELFISKRGTAALLAWNDGDHVAYQETTVDGWTDVSRIDTTKGIDRETAYKILEQRTLER